MKQDAYSALAYRYKRQMNDIVFYAYKGSPHMKEYQDFRIECYAKEMKSRLGDCRHSKTGQSLIRIYFMESENWENVLVTLIHEVSHHIDFKIRGYSAHDKPYYEIHKKLLVTALDMGIVSFEGIQKFWNSNAQNARKLAGLMRDYTPHPIPYKVDLCTIFVYNAFSVKELLKEREYRWNGTDQSWFREMGTDEALEEKEFLLGIGVPEGDIAISEMKGVVNRRKAEVLLYGVSYEKRDEVKNLGYRWDKEKRIWHKRIDGEDISAEERKTIFAIGGVRIQVLR